MPLATSNYNIEAGDVFKHIRKGTLYTVLAVANRDAHNEKKFPVTVVYRDGQGRVFARSIHIFDMKFVRFPKSDTV